MSKEFDEVARMAVRELYDHAYEEGYTAGQFANPNAKLDEIKIEKFKEESQLPPSSWPDVYSFQS